MENATLTLKPKWVGNSLAFFVPAEVQDELGLKQNEEVVVHIHKKATDQGKNYFPYSDLLKGKILVGNARRTDIPLQLNNTDFCA